MTTPHLRHLRAGDPPLHAPNAALMIDFDNVTLGIRSDLTKELKHLLNSDIIKGKVAVSRAYADWRRYHQYIVPLSESSIDLIFAPAFGTNKKNATDIRLAIDAMELVFTRPEIGTFILLSGDSDFSMLVIKLKEYGKYVIGVGIRESASDLLIQNCDEYYSYSDLAGLTKEADAPSTQKDPWALVQEAVATMARDGDVMRSDRLKQVMQQIDPNFDEKNAGYSRFSKFVLEASHKGLIKLSKMENGQYEVAPLGAAAEAPARAPTRAPRPEAVDPAEEGGAGEEGRSRRGRGRRGRGRGRGGEREVRDSGEHARPAEDRAPAAAAPAAPKQEGLTLARAFDLLRRALAELPSPSGHDAVRNRMSALYGRQDPLLDSGRFFRLLRQAHDAEVADVRKLGEDDYEVIGRRTDAGPVPGIAPSAAADAPGGEDQPPAVTNAEAASVRGGLRFRRGTRLGSASAVIPMIGVVNLEEEAPAAEPVKKGRAPARKKAAKPAPEASDEAEAPPAKKKAAPRTRAKKKAEE
ncbi:MAG: NYN domain-containing protein [Gemmatimonadetes bacterium]|nr:NYN domain-containing protein [Gemmatimonadota bacterium]MBK7784276.1 NYN domain-containing protein [Gemmatimonadota bacterium]